VTEKYRKNVMSVKKYFYLFVCLLKSGFALFIVVSQDADQYPEERVTKRNKKK
jgi:hypothetical protein